MPPTRGRIVSEDRILRELSALRRVLTSQTAAIETLDWNVRMFGNQLQKLVEARGIETDLEELQVQTKIRIDQMRAATENMSAAAVATEIDG